MSTLGKRKDREEGEASEVHGSTLFVSNLPYTATSTDLQTLFSDIAPVRSAFVVLEQGTGTSKGVGYVAFSLREDAQLAYDQVEKDGISLAGRGLRVTWASNKPRREKGGEVKIKNEEEAPKPKPKPHPKVPHPTIPRDPLAIRTVIISGLPPALDSNALWKKIRKCAGAESVEWPLKNGDAEDPSTAHVLFATPSQALDAVQKLHAHVFKGALLSVTLKKRLDTVAKAHPSKTPKLNCSATPGDASQSQPTSTKPNGPAPTRASRLIVRNLPFDITEQDLRAIFLPYGPIYSIDIPMSAPPTQANVKEDVDGDVKMQEATQSAYASRTAAKPRGKGFAFVWMWTKKEAEKALEGCNGMKVKAGFAEGMVKDKQRRKKERREEKKRLAREATAGNGEDGDGTEDEEGGTEAKALTSGERVIAVDWALSKEKWEVEKKRIEDEGEGEAEGSSSEESEDDEDDEGLGVHEHEGGSSDESDSEDEDDEGRSDEEERTKPQLPPPETGTTLFVRNVPFEATEDELRTLFRAFGPLRYARITLDPASGRSRGTGFACFWNKEDADKAVDQSNILRAETTGGPDVPKKNPFTMPSILTFDPSAASAQSLVLHGRTLDVVRAVTRDEAGKLKEAGEKAREKADKRNMYLLREGVILPNTPAAANLPAVEIEKRTNSFNARRQLLRTNPSLFISKTRLSIRQIPIFVTERMLKRLAIHAMRSFQAEVRKGTRTGLTEDEKADTGGKPGDEGDKDIKVEDVKEEGGKGKGKKPGRNTGVKQAKIVRQQDRVDAITGKGRSKGYGFLELHSHADALKVLRWANNNPAVGPLFEEWWKAEVEDLIKAHKAKKRAEKEKGEEEEDEVNTEARIKRLKDELEGGGRKAKGSLIVEFSIENVQVVHRRSAIQKDKTSGKDDKKPRREKLALPKAEPVEDTRVKKKARVSNSKDSAPDPGAAKTEAKGSQMGALIGRKRKERKVKKGGR